MGINVMVNSIMSQIIFIPQTSGSGGPMSDKEVKLVMSIIFVQYILLTCVAIYTYWRYRKERTSYKDLTFIQYFQGLSIPSWLAILCTCWCFETAIAIVIVLGAWVSTLW